MSSDQPRLRIVIVSEVRVWREALARILEADRLVSTVALCGDAEGAIAAVAANSDVAADVVLIDAAATDGARLVKRLRDIAPNIHLVVFGVMEHRGVIVPWAEAGITGYVSDTARLPEFVPLMLKIVAGEQPISRRTAAELFRWFAGTASPGTCGDTPSGALALTKRERQVA